jgi:hypothetical protein
MDIFSKLEQHKKLSEEIEDYFRRECLVWKAIQKYIYYAKPFECVFFNKTGPCMHYSASYGIHLKKYYYQAAGADDPQNTIRLCFNVDIQRFDGDEYLHDEYDIVDEMIDVPLDLFSDFTQEKFDTWVEDQKENMIKTQEALALHRIEEIVRHCPSLYDKPIEIKER